MKTALFRAMMQWVVVNSLLTFWDNLSVSSSRVKNPLELWASCPKTLVRNYHYSMCNSPEQNSSHINIFYKGTECYARKPPTRIFHTQDIIPIAIYVRQKPNQINTRHIANFTYSSEKAHDNTIIFTCCNCKHQTSCNVQSILINLEYQLTTIQVMII